MSDTRNHTTRDQLAEALEQVVADLNNRGAISDGYGWTEIAEALLASDAIAAVRAAAVAETTAAAAPILTYLEGIEDFFGDEPFADVIDCVDGASTSPALTFTDLRNLRAALSGGRTALDTALAEAWDDGYRNGSWDGQDFTTANPYRADTGADQ